MEYFVSFTHTSGRGDLGFGEATIPTPGPMTAELLRQTREFLARQFPGEQVAILSFQQLAPSTATV